MRSRALLHCLILALAGSAKATPTQSKSKYSLWMASSIMSRGQGILTGQGDASELLQAGLTQKVFRKLIDQYPEHPTANEIQEYIEKSVDSTVAYLSDLSDVTTYPLDRLSSGNNLVQLGVALDNDTYKATAQTLRDSIDAQRRNAIGGLWYYIYPGWSYLDGMYSLAPFYALYTNQFSSYNSSAYKDLIYQIDLLWDHCYVNSTGLLVHGYDFSRTAVWANKVTGASPHVWGRSLGWYMMALVDTLEILAQRQPSQRQPSLQVKLQRLSRAILKAADPYSGAWWQVVDQPGRAGNYIESSGSAMFVYALLKASRLHYISGSEEAAIRAYRHIVKNFVFEEVDSSLGFDGTVGVCSLNSSASFEYYINQPIIYNSVLGSASFVLASLEFEMLTSR